MAYQDVDTASRAARSSGDLTGRISIALIRQAYTRMNAIGQGEDQRELSMARAVIDGSAPATWTTIVMHALDIAAGGSVLANPTDANIDTAVNAAWARILRTR